jgi:hypothetical protein
VTAPLQLHRLAGRAGAWQQHAGGFSVSTVTVTVLAAGVLCGRSVSAVLFEHPFSYIAWLDVLGPGSQMKVHLVSAV